MRGKPVGCAARADVEYEVGNAAFPVVASASVGRTDAKREALLL